MNTTISDGFRHPLAAQIPTPSFDADGWYINFGFGAVTAFGVHVGEDWAADNGSAVGRAVFAASNGRVVAIGSDAIGGTYMLIEHDLPQPITVNGITTSVITTFYADLEENGNHLVEVGDIVSKGQQIGTVGFYPSEEPHLHFEIRLGDQFVFGGTAGSIGGVSVPPELANPTLFLNDFSVIEESEPTEGDDQIFGTADDDVVDGLGGNDTIEGRAGNDVLDGGAGLDLLIGNEGADLLSGGGGGDTLIGDAGNDTLNGGAGNDSLDGGFGFDTLNGDAGNDSLDGGAGNDRLFGNDDNDTLIGNFGFDRLDGGAGDDELNGSGGNDTLRGANGADTLNGDGGVDVVFGGGGADLVNGGAGNDRIRAQAGNDTINGGDNDDRAFGGFGFDSLRGNGGADLLDGGGGNDTLIGDAGNDTLIGNFGFDSLDGGVGFDVLEGAGGNDTVTGGGGDDAFRFALGDDNDRITDFVAGVGTDDVIELSGFGAAFDTFTEVLAVSSQAGADVLIAFGGGDAIRLLNTNLGDLHQDDFVFG